MIYLLDEESFLNGIHQLVCLGHNVIVFQVLDHDELTFPYDQTTRFIGLESDEDIVVDAALVLDRIILMHQVG